MEQTEEQFEIIKELIHRDDTDEIIKKGAVVNYYADPGH